MPEKIMSMALTNGIWAALFVFLFFYTLKDSKEREKSYQGVVKGLTEALGGQKEVVSEVKEFRKESLSAQKRTENALSDLFKILRRDNF